MKASTRTRVEQMALLEFRGDSYADIAARFNVSPGHVSRLLNTDEANEYRSMLRAKLTEEVFTERLASISQRRTQLPFDTIIEQLIERCRVRR